MARQAEDPPGDVQPPDGSQAAASNDQLATITAADPSPQGDPKLVRRLELNRRKREAAITKLMNQVWRLARWATPTGTPLGQQGDDIAAKIKALREEIDYLNHGILDDEEELGLPTPEAPSERTASDPLETVPGDLLLARLWMEPPPLPSHVPLPMATALTGDYGTLMAITVPQGRLDQPWNTPGGMLAHIAHEAAELMALHFWHVNGLDTQAPSVDFQIPDLEIDITINPADLQTIADHLVRCDQGAAEGLRWLFAQERLKTHGQDDPLYRRIHDETPADYFFKAVGLIQDGDDEDMLTDGLSAIAKGKVKWTAEAHSPEVHAEAYRHHGLVIGLMESPLPDVEGEPLLIARSTIMAELLLQILVQRGHLIACDRCERPCVKPDLPPYDAKREPICHTCRHADVNDKDKKRQRDHRKPGSGKRKKPA